MKNTRGPIGSTVPASTLTYLAMAVKYGLVPALIYFAVAIGLLFLLGACARNSGTTFQRGTFIGLAICLATIVTILFTVTVWGSMLAWFNFLLGMFVSYARNRSNYTYQAKR